MVYKSKVVNISKLLVDNKSSIGTMILSPQDQVLFYHSDKKIDETLRTEKELEEHLTKIFDKKDARGGAFVAALEEEKVPEENIQKISQSTVEFQSEDSVLEEDEASDVEDMPKKEAEVEEIPEAEKGEAGKKKLEPETKEEPKEPPKRKPSKMVQEDNFKKVVQTIVKEFFEDPEDPNSTYLSPMQEVVDRVYKKDLKPLHDLGIVTRGAVERLVSKIWEAMKHSTGPTGYKFVSYDKDHRAYTPNYTAALITKHLIKRMHIPQK